jgi:hypothetical protein
MKEKQGLILGAMAANLVLFGMLGFGLLSVRNTLTDRIAQVETANQEAADERSSDSKVNEKELASLISDMEVLKQRFGVTSTELKRARETAQALKRQQEKDAKEWAGQLASKANSSDVDGLNSKLADVQQDSNTKFGNVYGEVNGLKQEMVANRDDWGRQLLDVKNSLNDRIARNSGELAELRKKGERDYFEFDIRKNSKQPLNRVADIQLALLKTDIKKQKYNVAIQVDDHRLEKKDRTANEPVQFLVGREQLRYEVVVNSVDKDRIRGYVSAPKDKVLAAEVPRFRLQ